MKVKTIALLSTVLIAFGAEKLSALEFDMLNGAWSGNGTVKNANGSSEQLRCRALYRPNGASLGMRLTCASDSYKFELQSSLISVDGGLNGTWSETTRNIQGNLTGTVEGDRVRAVVTSPNFSATIVVLTSGRNQTVSIQSPGSSISVSISLRK